MAEMYDLLKEGLTESLEHAQGKRTLRTKKVRLPDPSKQYHAGDMKKNFGRSLGVKRVDDAHLPKK